MKFNYQLNNFNELAGFQAYIYIVCIKAKFDFKNFAPRSCLFPTKKHHGFSQRKAEKMQLLLLIIRFTV